MLRRGIVPYDGIAGFNRQDSAISVSHCTFFSDDSENPPRFPPYQCRKGKSIGNAAKYGGRYE